MFNNLLTKLVKGRLFWKNHLEKSQPPIRPHPGMPGKFFIRKIIQIKVKQKPPLIAINIWRKIVDGFFPRKLKNSFTKLVLSVGKFSGHP